MVKKTIIKRAQIPLRVCADDSNLQRLCVHYGTALEAEMDAIEGDVAACSAAFAAEVKPTEVVYGMMDGCFLPTRPQTMEGTAVGSWKEMK